MRLELWILCLSLSALAIGAFSGWEISGRQNVALLVGWLALGLWSFAVLSIIRSALDAAPLAPVRDSEQRPLVSPWDRRIPLLGGSLVALSIVVAGIAVPIHLIQSALRRGGEQASAESAGQSRATKAATLWTAHLKGTWDQGSLVLAGSNLVVFNGSNYIYSIRGERLAKLKGMDVQHFVGGAGGVLVFGAEPGGVATELVGVRASSGNRAWTGPSGIKPVVLGATALQIEGEYPYFLVAHRLSTGHVLWRTSIDSICPNTGTFSDCSHVSFSLGGDLAVVKAGSGLAAIDLSNGRKLWDRSLGIDFDFSGMDSSRIYLITNRSGNIRSLPEVIAIRRGSGAVEWRFRAPRSFESNGSSLAVPGKGPLLLFNTDNIPRYLTITRSDGSGRAGTGLPGDAWICSTCDIDLVPTVDGAMLDSQYLILGDSGQVEPLPCQDDFTFSGSYGVCLSASGLVRFDMGSGRIVGATNLVNPKAAVVTSRGRAYVVNELSDGSLALTALDLKRLA